MEEKKDNIVSLSGKEPEFMRHHHFELDAVSVGKKTFHVISIFPRRENGDETRGADSVIMSLLERKIG